MAEINVERKRGRNHVPLFLGALVLAFLLWLLSQTQDRDATADDSREAVVNTSPGPSAAAVPKVPEEVDEFVTWVQNSPADPGLGQEHEYTADGIRRLADALSAVAAQMPDRRAYAERLASLRERADDVRSAAQSRQHARITRDVFTQVAVLMKDIQAARGAESTLVVTQLREAAEAIRPDQELLQQTPAVRQFFERASAALQTM